MTNSSGYWYTLQAKPHKERQVAQYLRDRGFEVYVPLMRVNPVNPRASHERPFFPGYLFLRCNPDGVSGWAVQWTPGLLGFVQLGGEPALVSDTMIGELKQRISQIRFAGGQVFLGLQAGDAVKITNGPFAGYEAIFDLRLSGTERVRVFLKLIQQTGRRQPESQRLIPVELNAGSIERVRVK